MMASMLSASGSGIPASAANILRGVADQLLPFAATAFVVLTLFVWLKGRTRTARPGLIAERSPARAANRKTEHAKKPLATPAWTYDDKSARPAAWSIDLLRKLEWKRFEEICASVFSALGFVAKTTAIGADGGIDIELYSKKHPEKIAGIVQCKAWTKSKVGIKSVRELYGVMAAGKVANGYFVTTSEFTKDAIEFSSAEGLRLIDGHTFLKLIGKLGDEKARQLLEEALEGDYSTPTCPGCDIKMKLRTTRDNGTRFWGCANYPGCRQTFRYHPPS